MLEETIADMAEEEGRRLKDNLLRKMKSLAESGSKSFYDSKLINAEGFCDTIGMPRKIILAEYEFRPERYFAWCYYYKIDDSHYIGIVTCAINYISRLPFWFTNKAHQRVRDAVQLDNTLDDTDFYNDERYKRVTKDGGYFIRIGNVGEFPSSYLRDTLPISKNEFDEIRFTAAKVNSDKEKDAIGKIKASL